jgi:hypothetical protein
MKSPSFASCRCGNVRKLTERGRVGFRSGNFDETEFNYYLTGLFDGEVIIGGYGA